MDCKAKSAEGGDWAAYFSWLAEQGCRFPYIQVALHADGERALRAKKSFDGKDEIVFVPRSLMITPGLVHQSPLGALLKEHDVQLHSSQTLIALFILEEKRRGNSYWQFFLDHLPETYDHIPAYFSDERLDELKGSFTYRPILYRRQLIQREYETVRDKLGAVRDWSFEEVRWALTVVNTRCFSLPNEEGKDEPVVVPLADMMNHGEPANAKWRCDEPGGGLVIRARGPIAAGRQITISYGQKTKGRFFASYGFFDLNNDRWQAVLPIHIDKDDPYFGEKQTFVHRQQGPRFALHYRRYEKLARALRAVRCLLTDWHVAWERRMVLAGKVVSQENERMTMMYLVGLCRDALEAFPQTLEEDRALLLDETRMSRLSLPEQSVVQLRCSEKQVLTRVAAFAASVADLLEADTQEVLEVLVKPEAVEAWPPALRRWFQSWSEEMVPVLFAESGSRRLEEPLTRPMIGDDGEDGDEEAMLSEDAPKSSEK